MIEIKDLLMFYRVLSSSVLEGLLIHLMIHLEGVPLSSNGVP